MERYSEEERVEGEENGKLGFVKSDGGGMKVKIVLTREELEMLIMELKKSEGKLKLDEILSEIGERGRLEKKISEPWRPSLESIMETPEHHEMDRL